MVYQQFINPSKTELATAFNSFAANGVRELVVDLRYNGGGSVALARDFASMIGGTRLAGTTFAQLRYNTRHPEDNATYPFVAAPDIAAQPLSGLARVVIIASPGTASASELVINGFLPRDACGLTYSAVNFMSFNSQNQTFSGDGIAPTCEVADDLDHQLGDPAEARLSAALYYLKNGSCPTATARVATLRSGGSTQRAVAVDNAFGEVPAPRMLAD
jgi:hypothetical protein